MSYHEVRHVQTEGCGDARPPVVERSDELVIAGEYPNRSQAIESARLCPNEERAIAEEGFGAEGIDWPTC